MKHFIFIIGLVFDSILLRNDDRLWKMHVNCVGQEYSVLKSEKRNHSSSSMTKLIYSKSSRNRATATFWLFIWSTKEVKLPVFGRHIFWKVETVIPPGLNIKDIRHISLWNAIRNGLNFCIFHIWSHPIRLISHKTAFRSDCHSKYEIMRGLVWPPTYKKVL